MFLKNFFSLYEKFFPLTKVKLKPNRKKQRLYENFLKQRTPENKKTYISYKNLFQRIKVKSKKKFYCEKLIKFRDDAKRHGGL